MLRKISFITLFAFNLFSFNAMAAPTIIVTQANLGYELPYILEPNVPLTIKNPVFWEVKAVCTIETNDPFNDILIEAKSKNGTVNGSPISEGSKVSVKVHNNEQLNLTAERGAVVTLTNTSANKVTARCSLR